MRADSHENNRSFALLIKRTIVSGDVDATPTRIRIVDRMIVEEWMERFPDEKILSFYELHANVSRQLVISLEKFGVK